MITPSMHHARERARILLLRTSKALLELMLVSCYFTDVCVFFDNLFSNCLSGSGCVPSHDQLTCVGVCIQCTCSVCSTNLLYLFNGQPPFLPHRVLRAPLPPDRPSLHLGLFWLAGPSCASSQMYSWSRIDEVRSVFCTYVVSWGTWTSNSV